MRGDGSGQRMFRKFFEGAESLPVRVAALGPHEVRHLGTPFGQRSGLVQHHDIDPDSRFEALGVLYQNAVLGPFADSGHDGRGRRQPQGAGAGDDEHRDQRQQAVREPVLRVQQHPRCERDEGDADDHGHEDARDAVHELLHRGFAALRLLHQPDDLRQQGFAPDLRSREAETSPLVDGSGEHRVPGAFGCRHGLSGEHAFIDIGTALGDGSVHGDPLAGTCQQQVAGPDFGDRDLVLPSVRRDADHRCGLKSHQLADGFRGVVAGAGFEQAPQQDEGDDDARRLEIDVGMNAPGFPESGKEHVRHAEKIGHSGASGHQRVHVGRAAAELPPGIDEKITPQYEYHRGRQQPHEFVGIGHPHPEHPHNDYRHRQGDGPRRAAFQCAVAFARGLFRFPGGIPGPDDQVVPGLPHGFPQCGG